MLFTQVLLVLGCGVEFDYRRIFCQCPDLQASSKQVGENGVSSVPGIGKSNNLSSLMGHACVACFLLSRPFCKSPCNNGFIFEILCS